MRRARTLGATDPGRRNVAHHWVPPIAQNIPTLILIARSLKYPSRTVRVLAELHFTGPKAAVNGADSVR